MSNNTSCCGSYITNGSVPGAGDFDTITADEAFINTINSVANDNTTTVNGVNPLTTSTSLTAHIAATAAHGATGAVVGTTNSQTLTNKTIDSATNTVTITSAPLAGQDINNVLNQAVRTGSAVTFGTVTTQSILLSTAVNDAVTVRSSTPQNNQILFQSAVPTDQTGFGYDVLNSLHRIWGYLNSPMVFATNNLERLRIAAGGIANDNSITSILGLSGTTLAFKNNVVDTSTSQTLTNKTLTAPIINSPTLTNSGNTLTLPTTTTTLVGNNTTDTLTNKTLTTPTINSPTLTNSGNTLTLPAATDTLVGRATTDTLTNKTLIADNCIFQDNVVAGRVLRFDLGATNALELRSAQTADHVQIFPDADGDILLTTATQSITNKDFTNGTSSFAGKVTTVRATQTTTDASTVTFATIPIATNTSYMIQTDLVAYCTAGANINTSCAQRFITRAQQVAGVITGGNVSSVFSNQFATLLGHPASGTDILVQTTGIAANTINWACVVTVTAL
jgi:hypothetical protein